MFIQTCWFHSPESKHEHFSVLTNFLIIQNDLFKSACRTIFLLQNMLQMHTYTSKLIPLIKEKKDIIWCLCRIVDTLSGYILTCLTFRASQSFNKEVFVDFIAAQIKTLSFLAYIIRIYQVRLLKNWVIRLDFTVWKKIDNQVNSADRCVFYPTLEFFLYFRSNS